MKKANLFSTTVIPKNSTKLQYSNQVSKTNWIKIECYLQPYTSGWLKINYSDANPYIYSISNFSLKVLININARDRSIFTYTYTYIDLAVLNFIDFPSNKVPNTTTARRAIYTAVLNRLVMWWWPWHCK